MIKSDSQSISTVEQLLDSVGLHRDFLDHLMQESDWSLIIKLHAVFEAVLTSLIIRSLGTKAIEDQVAHLDFNNAKSGKVVFARSLGLLDKQCISFLRGLSELRNSLVHDIRNVAFDLKSHVLSLSKEELNSFRSKFGSAMCNLDGGEQLYQNTLTDKPKLIIYTAAYSCLLEMQFRISGRQAQLLVEAFLHASKSGAV